MAFLPRESDAFFYEKHDRTETIRRVVPAADQYHLMVKYFAECVLNNRQLRYPARDAQMKIRAIEALYRSARSGGKPVSI